MKEPSKPTPIVDRLRAADRERVDDDTRGKNRRYILTHRDELEAALATGYSLNRVFNLLRGEGVLRSDYSSFRRAARAVGLGEVRASVVQASKPKSAPSVEVKPPDKPAFKFERPSDEPREFVHNPRPKKEPWK